MDLLVKKLVIMVSLSLTGSSIAQRHNEPQCICSNFHYEEQLLEKMVRMEFAVEKMKNEMDDAKQSVLKTLEEFHHMKKKHEDNIGERLEELKSKRLTAFTARLSTHLYKLGMNQRIVFDNIVTNIGSAYSGTTGVFTAPNDGIYYFIATVMSHLGQHIETEVVVNGQTMVKMYSFDKDHEQGTSGVVLQLQTSDEVWVQHLKTQGENVYGDQWSTFSGFKLSD